MNLITFFAASALSVDAPVCLHPHHTEESRLTRVASERPPIVGSFASQNYPLVVHVQEGVDEVYARRMLSHAEASWESMFGKMGFLPPHRDGTLGGDDRFDIYVVTDLPSGVGGYAGFSGFEDGTPRADAVGYTVISHVLLPRYERGVIAHEMFHASQMAYDWWENISFMESSATLMSELVFDDENFYWRYFPYFNHEPWRPVNYVSLKSPYQYGSALWVLFLEERFGARDGQLLRRIWEQSPQNDFTNEPDYLDVAQGMFDGGLDSAQIEFGDWRLLVGSRDDGRHFREGGAYDTSMDPYLDLDISGRVDHVTGRLAEPLAPFGHAFLRIGRIPPEGSALRVTIKNEGSSRLVAKWHVRAANRIDGTGGELGPHSTLTFEIPQVADSAEVLVVLSNLGDGSYDPDTSPWTGSDVSYVIERIAR